MDATPLASTPSTVAHASDPASTMDSVFDYTHSTFSTPQSITMSPHEGHQDVRDDMERRATTAVWSLLENSNTKEVARTPRYGERHVNALASFSGSLMSTLVRFGDNPVREQTTSYLTKFVLDVMDTCVDKVQARDLADFLFKHILGSTNNATTDAPIELEEATWITPQKDVEDEINIKDKEDVACLEPPAKRRKISRRAYNPPPLTYDPVPIGQLGAHFVSDLFGSDVAPETVVDYVPTLSEYICDVISTTRVERSIAIYAFVLLDRLSIHRRVYMPQGTFGLFITAYMIAGKMLIDSPYNNKSWYIAGQKMFTVKELNNMERNMCSDLNWNLEVDMEELKSIEEKMLECYDAGISPVWSCAPTLYHGSSIPVTKQTPDSSPSSSSLVALSHFQAHDSGFVQGSPQMSLSSDPFAFDNSLKWSLPSLSAFRSPSFHQEKSIGGNKDLVWIGTDFEDQGCDQVNEDNEGAESGQLSDPDVF